MLDYISPLTHIPLHVEDNRLVSETGEQFPIINGIPRFVSSANYAAAFGLEWTIYSKTQLDSITGTTISQKRLKRCLGVGLAALKGKTILEAGCGAGRFTELMVEAGAYVHSFDLSVAVEANKHNIGEKPNYAVAQADIYAIPYPDASFDYVVCLGVLQHLPSPEQGIAELWQKVKPHGRLIIDHYTPTLSTYTKIGAAITRQILRRMDPENAMKITDRIVALFFPLHWSIRKFIFLQMLLSRVSPVYFYYHMYPYLSREEHYELSRLDTFDGLTDYYKHRRTVSQIRTILTKLGATNIRAARGGNGVEASAQK